MDHFLTAGIILGLSAGCSPGPLLTLVISETLTHGVKAGFKVALAPILTDFPIIVLTLFAGFLFIDGFRLTGIFPHP